MPKTERLSARIGGETRDQIDRLAELWGPVQPLSDADVIAEAVRRAILAEPKIAARKSRKSEPPPP